MSLQEDISDLGSYTNEPHTELRQDERPQMEIIANKIEHVHHQNI